MKNLKELEERASYVRRGGSVHVFSPAIVAALQDYALDVKDIRLYDVLETFWAGMENHKKAVRPR